MATRTGFGRRQYRAYVPHLLEGWEPALTAEDVDAVTVADRALVAAGTLPRSELAGGLARWMLARDESIRSSVIEGSTPRRRSSPGPSTRTRRAGRCPTRTTPSPSERHSR